MWVSVIWESNTTLDLKIHVPGSQKCTICYILKHKTFFETLLSHISLSLNASKLDLRALLCSTGTTWMQEVVPLIVSEGDLTPVLTVPNWDRVPWLEEHRAILLSLEQRPSPRVFATHFHHHMMNESYFKTKPRVKTHWISHTLCAV